MRTRIWLVVAVLATACAMAQGAVHGRARVNPTSEPQAQADVAHLEREWLGALDRADVNAIARILADDFLRPAPQSGHFIGKTELLRYYRSHLVPPKAEKKQIEDMIVIVYGSSAIARGKVVTRDAEGFAVSTLLFTDVFVRRAGKWQAVSAQENPVPGP
jgi:ketosteroid isomerase-like protein